MKKKGHIRKPSKFQKRLFLQVTHIILVYIILITFTIIFLGQIGFPIRSLQSPLTVLIVICFLGLILSTLSYWLFIHQISAPLSEMNRLFRQISKGNFEVQVEHRSHIEEVDHCIQNVNRMTKQLGSLEAQRNDFVANVSHEFKTPLSSIMGYGTLLQDPDLSQAEREEYAQKVLFHTERLRDMTDNLLLLSKLENQTVQLSTETYRLDEQIREAIVLQEEKWTQKQIELDIEMEEIEWCGPKGLLLTVWMNLIGNAIKFSDTGQTVQIRLTKTRDEIRASVSDDGIGMDEETATHIFEKFYQGDTSRRESGNGLGLALCQEIVAAIGGKIYVTSQPSHGSVFLVALSVEQLEQ